MRAHRNYGALIAAGAAVFAVATMVSTMPSAQAASVAQKPAKQTNVASASPLTANAKAAGVAKFGKGASYEQSLKAYWSTDRMAAAIPADSDPDLIAAATKYEARQQKRQAAGKKPRTNDGKTRAVTSATSKRFLAEAKYPAATNPNAPYYTSTAYTQGKVFFTKGSGSFVCSGTIVNSEGRDSVWTAGHCVHGGSGGTWHSNWTFVPAYDDDLANPRPYGTWSAAYLSSRTAWTNSSNFSQDIGVATMNTNFGGWHIVDYFGGQGLTVNRGKTVYEYAFGYPAESPFDGGNLMRCQGTTSPEWDIWFTWSQTVKIPCDMTRGSSGGAWLYGYDGNWGQLNGVNSRIDRIVGPTIMLSPYFDNDAWSLYNYTRYN